MSNKNKYFVALTGAKKNVGDFLITDRAFKLLQAIAPQYEFIPYPSWKAFDDMDFVNGSEGIIILGGPGFQINMYPGVYPLRPDLSSINVPIYTLGSGWKGTPGDRTTERLYRFSDSARRLLDIMEKTSAEMSCRDQKTLRVLHNNGYKNCDDDRMSCMVRYSVALQGIQGAG